MRKTIIAIALFVSLATLSYGQAGFNGEWVTTDFGNNPNYFGFTVEGTKLTGTIGRPQQHQADNISEGAVSGDTMTFKVAVANGGRINSYTGKLSGDIIAFTRSVKVRDEGANTGTGIYGAKGPMQFTAKRDIGSGLVAFYGSWKLNLMKSKFGPNTDSKPVVPDVVQFNTMGGGAFEFGVISADERGSLDFIESILKADGKDYPLDRRLDVAQFLTSGNNGTRATNSVKLIDSRTIEQTVKNNSTAGSTVLLMTMSPDGDTVTLTRKTVDAAGKQTADPSYVGVFDKVVVP